MVNLSRYAIPTVESFKGPIADDDFDIERAKNDEEKQQLRDARASKVWRTLRIASKSKFKLFDKIEDGNNLEVLFEPKLDEGLGISESNEAEATQEDSAMLQSEQVVSTGDFLEIGQ